MSIYKIYLLLLFLIYNVCAFPETQGNNDLIRAKTTLDLIFRLYDAGLDYLLNETYPYKPESKTSYLAGEDTVSGKKVAYLWPTSGVFSAVNALMHATGDKSYSDLLETTVLTGLSQYYDSLRKPACYQSYIFSAGESDRFYDDNVWLGIDFCESYELTGNINYLLQAGEIWKFVISGWDDNIGGGIYWCEQKKRSKNTCSNAPASVLAFKLFKATGDSLYFKWGQKIYDWTKTTLQDTTDYLYFDNKSLAGKVDKRKYTYNSGQMLQASALLYEITGNEEYLTEAQNIAESAINHFTKEYSTPEGKTIRLFKNTGNWFNAILFRGYIALSELDKKPDYIHIFKDNLDHVWNSARDKNGLFGKDWDKRGDNEYKWLLDQASLVEMWAVLAKYDLKN